MRLDIWTFSFFWNRLFVLSLKYHYLGLGAPWFGWIELNWTELRWEKCWISFSCSGTDCCFLLFDGSMQTRVWNIMIGGRALIRSLGYKLLVSSRSLMLYIQPMYIIVLVNIKSTFNLIISLATGQYELNLSWDGTYLRTHSPKPPL